MLDMLQTDGTVVYALLIRAYGVRLSFFLLQIFAIFAGTARICCIHAQYPKAYLAEEVSCLLYHFDSLVNLEQYPLQTIHWEGRSTRPNITMCIFEIQSSVFLDNVAESAWQEFLVALASCLTVFVAMIVGGLITRRFSS